jgi:hypothetical protein
VPLGFVVGCTESTPDVASLTAANVTNGADERSEQRRAAEDLYSCLVAAGLPVMLVEAGDAGTSVEFEEGHRVLSFVSDAQAGDSGGSSEDVSVEEYEEFKAAHDGGYALEIDGVDQSEVFGECYESSNYRPPIAPADAELDAEVRQMAVDITNAWIACAREQGFLELKDVGPNDPDEAWPTAELPVDMAPDALRKLLEECPLLTEEVAKRQTDPDFDPSQFVPNPVVRFGSAAAGNAEAMAESTRQHIAELEEIISEGLSAFDDENQELSYVDGSSDE